MDRQSPVTVRRVRWSEAIDALRAIRTKVFVDEQHVPQALEWDGLDDECLHVVAETASREAIGTGRLLPDGHIGRMAVMPAWRGKGVGRMLLTELTAAAAEHGHTEVVLSAQTHAIGFYQRSGFEVISEEYLDAGIPHRTMRLIRPAPR
ncbi:MAG: GCN5-related N-acetyltransferase [Betaproteobacteria bacterium]|nr:GCN5-related N-acetyltransferase [Betaproteobacteria bacterium]